MCSPVDNVPEYLHGKRATVVYRVILTGAYCRVGGAPMLGIGLGC